MELVVSQSDSKSSQMAVSDAIFGQKFNESLVHQVVTAYLAGMRQGSQNQKSRSDVSGGGAKPWRQKGTGRARAGTSRSPLWRKGGVTFAARPRDYDQKVNRKMYRAALKSILSELVRQDRLKVVDTFDVTAPKTKLLVKELAGLGLSRDVLIITTDLGESLYLSARNLPYVDVRSVSDVDAPSLVAYQDIVITQEAIKYFEEYLA